MKRWLVRLPAVALIAAGMGWLGSFLLFLGGPWAPGADDPWTWRVVGASVVLWATLSAALSRRRSPVDWAGWGLVSPLLGCLLVAPPASFGLILVKGYIAFPVGLATGLLLWGVFRVGTPADPAVQRPRPADAPPGRPQLHRGGPVRRSWS